jgi:hypothetical protein
MRIRCTAGLAPDHLNPDGTPNSNAFKLAGKPDPEPSVDLASLTTEAECLGRAGNRPGFRLGRLNVSELRAHGFEVEHRPTDADPAHSVIHGNSSKETCRRLAELTLVQ